MRIGLNFWSSRLHLPWLANRKGILLIVMTLSLAGRKAVKAFHQVLFHSVVYYLVLQLQISENFSPACYYGNHLFHKSRNQSKFLFSFDSIWTETLMVSSIEHKRQCIHYSFCCCDKFMAKATSTGKGLSGDSPLWQGRHGGRRVRKLIKFHLQSGSRERWMCSIHFLLLIQFNSPGHRKVSPTLRMGSPTSVNPT